MLYRAVLLAVVTAWTPAAAAQSTDLPDAPPDLKINQIQVLGTHNSYSLSVDPQLLALVGEAIEGGMAGMLDQMDEARRAEFLEHHPNFGRVTFAEGLAYSFPEGLAAQLDAGLRSLEIDVFRDPDGGRFLEPAGYAALVAQGIDPSTLLPHDTTDLEAPGFKVMHVADLDFRSTCNLLRACLGELRDWSEANAEHAPIFILLEAKDAGVPVFPDATEVLPFDGEAFDDLDAEIIEVLGRDRLITPDDVRGDFETLEAAVRANAWPTLEESRGKFVFLLLTALDTEGLSGYFDGRPNLEGRVAFLRSEPGQDHAAFLLLDNAIIRADEIPQRVREGYLVRTRSDIETYEAKVEDYARAEAAFSSGAQIVSTDFYRAGNAYGTDFVVTLPGGGSVRCNPVNSPC